MHSLVLIPVIVGIYHQNNSVCLGNLCAVISLGHVLIVQTLKQNVNKREMNHRENFEVYYKISLGFIQLHI